MLANAVRSESHVTIHGSCGGMRLGCVIYLQLAHEMTFFKINNNQVTHSQLVSYLVIILYFFTALL